MTSLSTSIKENLLVRSSTFLSEVVSFWFFFLFCFPYWWHTFLVEVSGYLF